MALYLKDIASCQRTSLPRRSTRQRCLRGEGLFIDNCAACHMNDGGGIAKVFPALMGSSAIQAREAANRAPSSSTGRRWPGRLAKRPSGDAGFGQKLNDQQVADVVTYVRNAWGNRGSWSMRELSPPSARQRRNRRKATRPRIGRTC